MSLIIKQVQKATRRLSYVDVTKLKNCENDKLSQTQDYIQVMSWIEDNLNFLFPEEKFPSSVSRIMIILGNKHIGLFPKNLHYLYSAFIFECVISQESYNFYKKHVMLFPKSSNARCFGRI